MHAASRPGSGRGPSYDPAAGVMPSREELDALAVSWPSPRAPGAPRSRLARLAGALAALPGRRLVLVTVRGRSMEPTYHERDRVLVVRGTGARRGRVVVVANPREEGAHLIKRVLAVPGDPVPGDLAPTLAGVPERRVPSGSLVLIGDNPEQSLDSRQLGYFPASAVLGRLLRDLWRRP
ncbi:MULTISPECIES: S26 family signal peptidase [unclassified Streptomyces]|uniref:S26 family signal peptidase n=1 Tax=unclassified Streptomyces TaxID=2593676 RepID=UPI002886F387|nr:S26 family signal peptidase [Streptomyces sp. DSM 41633]